MGGQRQLTLTLVFGVLNPKGWVTDREGLELTPLSLIGSPEGTSRRHLLPLPRQQPSLCRATFLSFLQFTGIEESSSLCSRPGVHTRGGAGVSDSKKDLGCTETNNGSRKDVQPPERRPMEHIYGECRTENEIESGDLMRCRERGYRIMFKQRTGRWVGLCSVEHGDSGVRH